MGSKHLPIWINVDKHGDMGRQGYELWQGRVGYEYDNGYSGPVIWNNLPDCLKNLETVDSFHRHCIKWMKSSLSFNL